MVDLGFGAVPVTTVELHDRLARSIGRRIDVLGLEIDPGRVAAAKAWVGAGVTFAVGGFEVPAPRPPQVIRAMNVLRQYDESDVPAAWAVMTRALTPDGLLIEGTCDELGRLGSWVTVDAAGTPRTLTLSVRLAGLERPSEVAERLPKALIHRNVPGTAVHRLLRSLDDAWLRTAAHGVFGPRQRWTAALRLARASGVPLLPPVSRWPLGEATVPWNAVAD